MTDQINPSHYTYGTVECIEAIESLKPLPYPGADFCRGNVIKYLWRLGEKDPAKILEDAEKARWYLNRLIERIES